MNLARPLLALSLLLALSALAGTLAAALNTPPAWFTVVFELIIVLAAAFGVIASTRGPSADGLALTLLCIAGTVFAASILGYVGMGQTRSIGGVSLRPFLLSRLGVAALFAIASAWIALGPDRTRSLPRALLGLALGAPVIACAGLAYTGHLAAWTAPLGQSARAVLAVAGFLALTGLLAASVQILMAAFSRRESGIDEPSPASSTPPPPHSPPAA